MAVPDRGLKARRPMQRGRQKPALMPKKTVVAGTIKSVKPKPTLTPGPTGGPARPPSPKPGLETAPSPATPARPKPVPQKPEFDQPYFDAVDRVNRREQSSLSALDQKEQAVKFEFGLDDPTNPFNRANAMKAAYLARARAASANLASRGQLYSGAHERALSRTRREEEQARFALRNEYESAINNIGAQKAGVKFDSEEEKAAAFEAWLARAPEADVPLPDSRPAPLAQMPELADEGPRVPRTNWSTPANTARADEPVGRPVGRQPTTQKSGKPKAGLPLAPPPPPDSKKKGKGTAKTDPKRPNTAAGVGYTVRDKQDKKKKKKGPR
jgi:hypothetical protein